MLKWLSTQMHVKLKAITYGVILTFYNICNVLVNCVDELIEADLNLMINA